MGVVKSSPSCLIHGSRKVLSNPSSVTPLLSPAAAKREWVCSTLLSFRVSKATNDVFGDLDCATACLDHILILSGDHQDACVDHPKKSDGVLLGLHCMGLEVRCSSLAIALHGS